MFDHPISDVDFFRVEGIPPRLPEAQRRRLLGKAVWRIGYSETFPFASYTPSGEENFSIGFLDDKPKQNEYKIDDMVAIYDGRRDLPPTPAAKRAFIELLYKTQRKRLGNEGYWIYGLHRMFPKGWEYIPRSNFNLFRGPFFSYYFLSDGRLVLALDTATHYVHSETFLDEIYGRDRTLNRFTKEMETEKERYRSLGREFKGIYFFNILRWKSIPIDGIDPRPISEITFEDPKIGFKGSLVGYLRGTYGWNKRVQHIDPNQPGVRSDTYTYAPQMLHRHANNNEIPRNILNEMTHLLDVKGKGRERDLDYPARRRWDLMQEELRHFQYIDLTRSIIKFNGSLTTSADTNRFPKPNLLVKEGESPIKPESIPYALKMSGAYRSPNIDQILMYTVDDEIWEPFWLKFRDFCKENLGWLNIPPVPLLLEKSENAIREHFRRGHPGIREACLGLIANSEQRMMLKRICSEFNVPLQCVRLHTASDVVEKDYRGMLDGLCAGLFSKAGGIPWILHENSQLNYSYYAAVDVGRKLAQYWACTICNNRGVMEISPSEIATGEKLERSAIERILSNILSGGTPKSFILLRDGDVNPTESDMFKQVIERTEIKNSAVIWVKKNIPHRLYRQLNGEISKPLSGDYLRIDKESILLCSAGADEYEHGTPQPRLLRITPIGGDIDFVKVAQDIFSLSYLNWGSPKHSYAESAPLRLAHKQASLLADGISGIDLPF